MHAPKLTKWQREMLAYAVSVGIEDARIEYGGRHPHVVGVYRGAELRRAIANTPSDALRARTKAQCDTRRELRRIEGNTRKGSTFLPSFRVTGTYKT